MVPKNSSTSNFKIPAAFTSALILSSILLFGGLLLPVNAFTHRLWEALVVHKFHSLLPGPFYPNQKISMQEQGDLAPYTRFSIKKEVSWETDRFGYRKEDSGDSNYEVVIVGDSTTVGTGLNQSEMLSEKLETIIKKRVYPFAPYYQMDTYLQSRFYKEHPPKIVIFSMMEWALPDLTEKTLGPNETALSETSIPKWTQSLAILLDRTSKLSLLRFLTARVKGLVKNKVTKPPFLTVQTPDGWMVFPSGKAAPRKILLEKIPEIVSVLKRYQSELEKQGIEMYFLPVPNKESLYYRITPEKRVPIFYLTLSETARASGIPTLNLLEFYANARVTSQKLLYQLDDSHWNQYGTELAARGIAEMIEAPKKRSRERTAV